MLRFLMICLMVLPFYGCESIQLTRYLTARYCPEVLVLKGAERLSQSRDGRPIMEAQLARFNISCDVDMRGANIDDPKFAVSDIDLAITFRGLVRGSAQGVRLPLFLAVLRKSDRQLIWRQMATINAEKGAFSHTMALTFPQAHKLTKGKHILLGGFIVNEAQIDKNLKPYISRQKVESRPQG